MELRRHMSELVRPLKQKQQSNTPKTLHNQPDIDLDIKVQGLVRFGLWEGKGLGVLNTRSTLAVTVRKIYKTWGILLSLQRCWDFVMMPLRTESWCRRRSIVQPFL